ncbi:MAG: PEGA domain-containing protein [Polyangiaceae bacterium]|nr:PEGA domain-containing protein [Polyangiaceae bacterium]
MGAKAVMAAALLLCASGCVARTPETVSLRMNGNVPTASVTVDDQYLGALAYVAAHGVALPIGVHRVTVEKAGYFAWDKLVEAKSGGGPILLTVELVRVPD